MMEKQQILKRLDHDDHCKYTTTSEFNKLTTENFPARLAQSNLVTETDFDPKLISFKKRLT